MTGSHEYMVYLKIIGRTKLWDKTRIYTWKIDLHDIADLSPQLVYFLHCLWKRSRHGHVRNLANILWA